MASSIETGSETKITWLRHPDTCNVLFENFAEDEYQFKGDTVNDNNAEKYNVIREAFLAQESPTPIDVEVKAIIESNQDIAIVNNNSANSIVNVKNLLGITQDKPNEFFNVSLDYQEFRRKLLLLEEEQYKTRFTEQITESIKALKEKKSAIPNTPETNKDTKKLIATAEKMCNYKLGKQFNIEHKFNKTDVNNPLMPASWMFTPVISYVGVMQAIELGFNYVESKNKITVDTSFKCLDITQYNIICTSASVRTIMTAIISLYVYLLQDLHMEPKTVYVIPFINEKPNGGSLNKADISNDPIPAGIIDKIIIEIQAWINKKFVDYYNEYNTNIKRTVDEHDFKKLYKNDIKFITKKVIINTELYLKYHARKIEIDKKVEFVVGTIIPEILNSSNVEPKVLAFTHGNLINDRRLANDKNALIFEPFPNNCSAWVEKFVGNKPSGISTYTKTYDAPNINELQGHRGSQVRRKLIVTPIDELRNLLTDNFCSLEDGNLRGDINKVWWNYKNKEKESLPFEWKWTSSTTNATRWNPPPNEPPAIDFDKTTSFNNDDLSALMIQGGTRKRKARRRTIKRRNNKKTKSSKRKKTKSNTRRHVKKRISRRIKK
jgi:hypothetical protein